MAGWGFARVEGSRTDAVSHFSLGHIIISDLAAEAAVVLP